MERLRLADEIQVNMKEGGNVAMVEAAAVVVAGSSTDLPPGLDATTLLLLLAPFIHRGILVEYILCTCYCSFFFLFLFILLFFLRFSLWRR